MKRSYKAAALMFALLLIFSALPVFAVHTADYNAHDVEKLRAFFELTGASSFPNGRAINGPGYDPDSPATWTSCTWNGAGRLVSIVFDDLGYNVVGCLDLAGCTALTTITASDCYLDSVDFSGCSALVSVDLTGNHLTAIDVTECPQLELLWFKQNGVSGVDLSGCPLLTSLDCSYNDFTELDVTGCPLLTILRCGNNRIASLDVSNCPRIVELNCKSNILTSLDISALTELERLFSFGNLLRRLDLSVMNGGESFVVEAVGNGYIGTKCYYTADGVDIYASAAAAEGESFLGWYEGGVQIADTENCLCPLGEGARTLSAHFTGSGTLLGDADSNGAVNTADALLTLRYSLRLVSDGEIDLAAADVNFDGTVTSADALLILRYAIGVLSGF